MLSTPTSARPVARTRTVTCEASDKAAHQFWTKVQDIYGRSRKVSIMPVDIDHVVDQDLRNQCSETQLVISLFSTASEYGFEIMVYEALTFTLYLKKSKK